MTSDFSRKTFDAATVLKAAGLIAASTTGSIILDLGDALMDADLVLDVTAIEIASNDEIYTINIEGSNIPGMATGSMTLAAIVLGNAPAPADADTGVGRHVVPFRNELNGQLFRYIRLYTGVVGTIATGINFSAFLAKKN